MSQPTTAGADVRSVLDKLKGYTPLAIMAIVVISQGAGLVLSGALQSFQGSFSIVLVGTPIVTVVAVLRNGMQRYPMGLGQALASREVWLEGLGSLRWRNFNTRQRQAIIALAVTSALINLGGPVAVRELGSGLNAAITTFGSLAAGALALRYLPQWLARGVALVAVLLAAKLSGDGGFTTLGMVAAICAASHMWNLPKQVVRLKPRQDEGLAVANLISAPFVLIGTLTWDHSQGTSWTWGPQEITGALCAGLLVMVIPVFLQNLAAKLGMTEQDQGAMAALASPLHALVGWALAPITLVIAGTAAVQPNLEQIGLFAILAMAAVAAPLMPQDKPRREAEAAPDEATAKIQEADVARDEAAAKADEFPRQVEAAADQVAALDDRNAGAQSSVASGDGFSVESPRSVTYTPGGGFRITDAREVRLRRGGFAVTALGARTANVGDDGRFEGTGMITGTVVYDGKEIAFGMAQRIEASPVGLFIESPASVSSTGGSAE